MIENVVFLLQQQISRIELKSTSISIEKNDFQESTAVAKKIENNDNNKLTSLRKIYICGWDYASILHSQFFPEHREALKSGIHLGSIKEDVLHTLQNATKNDWFISGGVQHCRHDELALGFNFRKDWMWHRWLNDNFKGTYIVCKFQFQTEKSIYVMSACSLLLLFQL